MDGIPYTGDWEDVVVSFDDEMDEIEHSAMIPLGLAAIEGDEIDRRKP